ncbi:TolC family protein [Dysgonomonas sp. 216]|uniref:TolC family protein n=1 Tax=Dysgonomonas sp. 216 TaxID=2302934 RepID=UPI0013D04FC2|nr:TolC family protein [Dysgonomonas sp. 216]NDW17711.1 TolC family protein [Dysgonomonas sp. 216]
MKHLILYISITILGIGNILAQSSIEDVLTNIEQNNKMLISARQSSELQKIDARTGIYLPNPNVEYERLWGNRASDNTIENELTVAQEFDFPTAYFQRNKIVNLKTDQANIQYRAARQNILLEAKQLCISLIYYNKVKEILEKRLNNAESLNLSYRKRLETGDANLLETNKIALELLNVQTEYRTNEAERSNLLKKLTEMNGGTNIVFTQTVYPLSEELINLEQIAQKRLEANPELKSLEHQKMIAQRSVSLAKSLALPKFNLGYKMSFSGSERFYGFVAGLSIPLWENKNTVKRAKAEMVLTEMEIDNTQLMQRSEVNQLFDKAMALKKSCDDFKNLLSAQNNEQLLSKALNLGQISLLEYLTEINFLYQSTENYLQTEKDYHSTIAELLKTDL